MKLGLQLIRWSVGLLFIFSGLVKANDPLGLSYKMQEFFEVWHWHGFEQYTLVTSVILNSVEVIAGVALLTGWAFRYVSWLLLGLILVFTGLTGYTFFTGLPKNCGCFGDCLPISSGVSFGKDVVLLLLIGVLLFRTSEKKNPDHSWWRSSSVWIAALCTIGLQLYALRYLPPVDCLPYRQGASIPEGMKIPSNAIADSFLIEFTYRKNGKEVRFPAHQFPADFSSEYTFVRREDKLVRKGSNNEAPIKGFALQGLSGTDSTEIILSAGPALWVWAASIASFDDWKEQLSLLNREAKKRNFPILFITAQPQEAARQLATIDLGHIPVYGCDLKAIQTAARVDPTVMLVNKGTIVKKRSAYKGLSIIE